MYSFFWFNFRILIFGCPKRYKEYDFGILESHEAYSREFRKFIFYYFIEGMYVLRQEIEVSFLDSLTPKERLLAKQLVRNNLRLDHTILYYGAKGLKDYGSVPYLIRRFATETDYGLLLEISQAIRKITDDNFYRQPFKSSLQDMSDTDIRDITISYQTLESEHLAGIPDKQPIEILLSALDYSTEYVSVAALLELNYIESNVRHRESLLPHNAEYYKAKQGQDDFLEEMDNKLKKICGE